MNPDALYVPLGDKVTEVLLHLAQLGVIREKQVLAGLPHPSGANAERIKFFLDEKDEKELSKKTNATTLSKAKANLIEKLAG